MTLDEILELVGPLDDSADEECRQVSLPLSQRP